jgi:AcrR family transcriptional regulator
LLRLRQVAEEEPEQLVQAVAELSPFPPVSDLAERLAQLAPDLGPLDSRAMALALVSLAAQRWRWEPVELGRLVSESPDLDVPEENREDFARVVRALVELDSLRTMAQALDVMSQQEHVFQRARILTDVRPIFEEDASVGPSAAVVMHTLRLEHLTDGHVESINVSLDEQDLSDLRAALDRAVDKADTLRDVVARAGIPQFELKSDDGDA